MRGRIHAARFQRGSRTLALESLLFVFEMSRTGLRTRQLQQPVFLGQAWDLVLDDSVTEELLKGDPFIWMTLQKAPHQPLQRVAHVYLAWESNFVFTLLNPS